MVKHMTKNLKEHEDVNLHIKKDTVRYIIVFILFLMCLVSTFTTLYYSNNISDICKNLLNNEIVISLFVVSIIICLIIIQFIILMIIAAMIMEKI